MNASTLQATAPADQGSPLVSVVIPVYNCERFVGEAIVSALAQSHRPMEIIAVDDGSTDGTRDVLQSFSPSVTVISQKNKGVSAARNAGIAASKGRYIAFLDADDLWHSDKIARQVNLLERYPSAVACYVDHQVIDANGTVLSPTSALFGPRCSGTITKDLLEFTMIVTPSVVMVRRSALDRVGPFRESLKIAEDLNIWLRLSVIGPILYDIETLTSYRRHGSNNYKGMSAEVATMILKAVYDFEQSLPQNSDLGIRKLVAAAVTRKMLDTAHWQIAEGHYALAWRQYLRTLRRQPTVAACKGLALAARGILGQVLRANTLNER